MIILWLLLYWVIGIAFMAVWSTVTRDTEADSEFNVIGSIIWPVLLVVLICIGFYGLIYGAVEKLVRWFMKK